MVNCYQFIMTINDNQNEAYYCNLWLDIVSESDGVSLYMWENSFYNFQSYNYNFSITFIVKLRKYCFWVILLRNNTLKLTK